MKTTDMLQRKAWQLDWCKVLHNTPTVQYLLKLSLALLIVISVVIAVVLLLFKRLTVGCSGRQW